MASSSAGGMTWSWVPTTAQEGSVFHAGTPDGSEPTLTANGRWPVAGGLASVVFALLALEDLGLTAARTAITVIAFTVLLSVLTHGLSAEPLARRYGSQLTALPGAAAPEGSPSIPERRLIRRSPTAR
jgi:hypothetical protein